MFPDREFRSDVPREVSPNGQWGYNATLGNAVGPTSFGVLRSFDGGPAPHLRVTPVGTTPSRGEPNLCFPSNARPWCSVD